MNANLEAFKALTSISFLSQLVPLEHTVPEGKRRKVYHGDYDSVPSERFVPKRSITKQDYGKNRIIVLNAMIKIGKACSFAQIFEITNLDRSTVNKWVKVLVAEKLAVKVRDATRGKDKLPSLWKLL